jgi:nicotinic acid phosphoribosyltransferase
VVAVLSDGYGIFNACDNVWGGELRQAAIDSGATVVVRPDSGDPTMKVDDEWRDVYKAPVGDVGKASRKGRLTQVGDGEEFRTVRIADSGDEKQAEADALVTVFEDGRTLSDASFDEERGRAAAGYGRIRFDWQIDHEQCRSGWVSPSRKKSLMQYQTFL